MLTLICIVLVLQLLIASFIAYLVYFIATKKDGGKMPISIEMPFKKQLLDMLDPMVHTDEKEWLMEQENH